MFLIITLLYNSWRLEFIHLIFHPYRQNRKQNITGNTMDDLWFLTITPSNPEPEALKDPNTSPCHQHALLLCNPFIFYRYQELFLIYFWISLDSGLCRLCWILISLNLFSVVRQALSTPAAQAIVSMNIFAFSGT